MTCRREKAVHAWSWPRLLRSLGAFGERPAWGALLVSFFVGAALIAALVDIPIFARITVAEGSQIQAALVLVEFLVALPVGALLGGVLTDLLSWEWIFFVNIPLCLIAGAMLMRNLHENVTRQHRSIDYTGAVLLTLGCSAVLLGLLEGGVAWSWTSRRRA